MRSAERRAFLVAPADSSGVAFSGFRCDEKDHAGPWIPAGMGSAACQGGIGQRSEQTYAGIGNCLKAGSLRLLGGRDIIHTGAVEMKKAHLKKLEKAANFLREVYDDLETEGTDDFDEFGTRLDEAAAAIEDILEDVESASKDDDADEGFEVE